MWTEASMEDLLGGLRLAGFLPESLPQELMRAWEGLRG